MERGARDHRSSRRARPLRGRPRVCRAVAGACRRASRCAGCSRRCSASSRSSSPGEPQLDRSALRDRDHRPRSARGRRRRACREIVDALRAYYARSRISPAARSSPALVAGDVPGAGHAAARRSTPGRGPRIGDVDGHGRRRRSAAASVLVAAAARARPALRSARASTARVDALRGGACATLGYYEARGRLVGRRSPKTARPRDLTRRCRARPARAGGVCRRSAAREPARHAGADPPGAQRRSRSARGRLAATSKPSCASRDIARRRRRTRAKQRGGEMVLTFTVARGPLHRLRAVDVVGNAAIAAGRPRAAPAAASRASRSSTAAWRPWPSASTELYRVRGFARVGVKPEVTVLPARIDDGQDVSAGGRALRGHRRRCRPRWARSTSRAPSRFPRRGSAPLLALSSRPPVLPAAARRRSRRHRAAVSQRGISGRRASPPSRRSRDDGARHRRALGDSRGPADASSITCWSAATCDTSSELIRREIALQPGKPLGEDAIIESQRRLAALGLFRRVRIAELPHGASANRDVLIEVEEAPSTTVSLRRRCRGRPPAAARPTTAARPKRGFEVAPRGVLRGQPAQSLGQEPVDQPVHARELPPARSGDRFDRSHRRRRLRLQRVSRRRHVPRAAAVRPAGRGCSSPPFSNRRSDRASTSGGAACRAEYARRLGTALTVSGRYALRSHAPVRRADRARRSAAGRSPVSAGAAVDVHRRRSCAIRATTCSTRSAAR